MLCCQPTFPNTAFRLDILIRQSSEHSSFVVSYMCSLVPRKAIIDELVSKMSSPDESKAATAAKNVFDIVRE